ncbi:MAG: hypothetical protein GY874_02725, partial [Desulfobacteraceae bacterium]|nr:hypothetical protein [Desulfobacteraceae bacterium]
KALSEINEVKEYQLDGGDGTVRTMYRGAGEIRKQISILENEIEALYRKLSGAGVISMQLRRKR